jgi:hypothetical protein
MAVSKHIWMYHTASHHLKPAGLFTNPTTFSLAHNTLDIHLKGWFCERKIRTSISGFQAFIKKKIVEMYQGYILDVLNLCVCPPPSPPLEKT